MLNEPVSLLSVFCCSPAFTGFPGGRGPGGWVAERIGEFFISSNYIKLDKKLEANPASVKEEILINPLAAEVLARKVKSGKLRRRHKQNSWEDGESLRIGGSGRISKMDHPRLCPRPIVCLHHGSAKRAAETEEPGEFGGSKGREGLKGERECKAAFCDRGAKIPEVESAFGSAEAQLSHCS